MAFIECRGLYHDYNAGMENEYRALDNVSLRVEKGEFVTILGTNGSGKSTLAKHFNALLQPTAGKCLVDGIDTSDEARLWDIRSRVGMVFQNPDNQIIAAIVEDDIGFGPENIGMEPHEIRRRVTAALKAVNMEEFRHFAPHLLSGGQKQRVAIARALVNRPKVLLLDEPLAALDLKLRKDMQIELKRIQQQVGITFIYVTHDQEEALTMSDTIVVMDKGTIQQIGTPEDIYNEPKNAFVADFIGESNIIDGVMLRDKCVKMYGREFACLDGGFAENEPVDVVIRPEDIDIVPVEQGQLVGTVTNVTFKGMQYDIIVDFKGFKWLIQTTDHSPVGARIGIKIDPDGIHVMKKSKYSGMFGDYSSFSEEYDELDDATLALDEEESGDEE